MIFLTFQVDTHSSILYHLNRFSRMIKGSQRKSMIEQTNIAEQVDADFKRARRRSALGWLVARLLRRPERNRLPSFEEARKAAGAEGRVYLGRKAVEVSKIVGSVGRHGDFDRNFMPTNRSLGERWKKLDLAFHRTRKFPPVELYKLGADYYVLDGNHRVSVARFHKVEVIEAEVTAFHPKLTENPAPENTDEVPAPTAS